MEYSRFVSLLRNASGVASDGGSIQEECGYLAMPCLILRSATERPDGLGDSAMLWKQDCDVVDQFIARLRTDGGPASIADSQPSPSASIVDALLDRDFEKR